MGGGLRRAGALALKGVLEKGMAARVDRAVAPVLFPTLRHLFQMPLPPSVQIISRFFPSRPRRKRSVRNSSQWAALSAVARR